jgi:hypothetical protein
MKRKALILVTALSLGSMSLCADDEHVQQEIEQLKKQTQALEAQLNRLQKKLVVSAKQKPVKHSQATRPKPKADVKKDITTKHATTHASPVSVMSLNHHPESVELNPAALIADGHVVTYISGMPVVTAPYLGAYPAFDGSDYIVNISSINRDIRLMQQRRRLYNAYEHMGYARPNLPTVALSGKAEPIGTWNQSKMGTSSGDWTLGSSELDIAAAVNDKVEAYLALAYDASPPAVGPRVSNSSIDLNMGFINIGDLDESPYYFTAGQLFVPFGRFSTAMVSAPLTMRIARTKTRPFILGYKSPHETGPFAAVYAYKSDTTLGNSAVGGGNLGYVYNTGKMAGEIGASVISSLNDAGGLQVTGSTPGTTFGGFSSQTNGSEYVYKTPGAGVHGTLAFDRYSLTAEWVSSIGRFHAEDLSFNGLGAQIQAAQLEAGATFMVFDKPASVGLGYQWSKDTLALNLPEHRVNGVFNISIWKDTVESLEYRHDVDFGRNEFGNGAAPPGIVNANTYGTGNGADTVLAQIGVYF